MKLQVRIHLASGTNVDTFLDEPEGDVEVEDFIETLIKGETGSTSYAKPRWTWIGDVYLFTQTVEGIEVL